MLLKHISMWSKSQSLDFSLPLLFALADLQHLTQVVNSPHLQVVPPSDGSGGTNWENDAVLDHFLISRHFQVTEHHIKRELLYNNSVINAVTDHAAVSVHVTVI